MCLPGFHLDLSGPKISCPPQECQSHLEHEVQLQTACQALQREPLVVCISTTQVVIDA